MNREILFKAKRRDNGEWVEGSLINTKKGVAYIIRSKSKAFIPKGKNIICSAECYEIDPDTICQFTGLTDKNGKKIWENDILIIEDGTLDEEDGCFICKWDDYAARYILDGNGLIADFDNVDTRYVEIIGNIFDNADLLEVKL